ncbi:MAG: TIM-barrel domain-containing protein [Bacteroidota bacterium]
MKRISNFSFTILIFSLLCISCTRDNKSFVENDKGITISFPADKLDHKLTLDVITEDIVQVRAYEGDTMAFQPSLIAMDDIGNPQTSWSAEQKKDKVILKTNKISIEINLNDGRIAYYDKDGQQVLAEGQREINDTSVYGEPHTYSITQHFDWTEDEALYGLGQHQQGYMNYRGKALDLWQFNYTAVIPTLVSTNGYGILWDNYSNSKFRDNEEGSFLWSEVSDGINYYFMYGPELDDVVANYRQVTGSAPMPPKWLMGYIQSKERYKTQEEVLRVAGEYRERQIPIDLIVQDWQYWEGEKWGQKSFNPEQFPDPKAMTDKLHDELNMHIMISIWPKMAKSAPDYQELHEAGHIYSQGGEVLGIPTYCYDAFSEEAREIYWEQANTGLFKYGIDAWWCDATEPEVNNWDTDRESLRKMMEPAIGSGARYMNAYSLMQAKGIYENQRKTTEEKRVVNLTRSAFAGQQRYGAITWNGDVNAKWDVFADQIPAGLNTCMAGLPYWTTDIGAFFVGKREDLWFWDGDYPKGVKDDDYKELYVRWFQYGAFTPLFRSHGTDTPREVWRFGEPGHWAYDALVQSINLRYRLLPYIYSMAWKVTDQDFTIYRGLAFDFRNDPNVYNIADQFMFGKSMMICPVVEEKASSREVYLPEGTQWFDFWTGEKIEGGQTITVPVSIDKIPIFVKAGTILPMGPVRQYATQQTDRPTELRVYPGNDATFVLYEDENDNYNYEKGKYATVEMNYSESNQELQIEERKGSFEGMDAEKEFQVVIVSEQQGHGLEMPEEDTPVMKYDGSKL